MLINEKATLVKNDMPRLASASNCFDLQQRQADIPVMSKEFHSTSALRCY